MVRLQNIPRIRAGKNPEAANEKAADTKNKMSAGFCWATKAAKTATINNNVVLDKQKGDSSKSFSDSLSEVEKETEQKDNKSIRAQNSEEVDNLMATIPQDIARKFKDLKDTLEMMETKKSDNSKP